MKRMQIDFAAQRLPMFGGAQNRALWWSVLALASAMFLISLGVIWRAGVTSADLRAQIDELQESTRSVEVARQQGSGLSADEQDVVNGAVRYLNYPWADLLGALEKHARQEVTLVSLEMGITRPSIKMVIQSAEIAEALAYVDVIKEEPALRGVMVTKHEETMQDGARGVRVTLEIPQAGQTARRAPRGESR